MILMAELGDKTQLVTANQAARHSDSVMGMGMVFSLPRWLCGAYHCWESLPANSWCVLFRSAGFTARQDSCSWFSVSRRCGSLGGCRL